MRSHSKPQAEYNNIYQRCHSQSTKESGLFPVVLRLYRAESQLPAEWRSWSANLAKPIGDQPCLKPQEFLKRIAIKH
jgi:NADH:ubiquinone oxidoreductase subunit